MHTRRRFNPLLAGLAALLLVAFAAFVAACGEDDTSSSSASVRGNQTDRAFAEQMAAHHQGAVEMAEVARERGQRSQVKAIADDIIRSQNAEITVLNRVAGQLRDAGVGRGDLGMDEHAMSMDPDTEMLRSSDPFDRAFIDMMVPHHESAIEMARVELDKGENPELRRLAEAIIDAQEREPEEMRQWRLEWYGKATPTLEDEMEDDHDATGHGG